MRIVHAFVLSNLLLFFSLQGSDIVSESILYPPDQGEIKICLEGFFEKRNVPYRSRYPDGKEVDKYRAVIIFKPLDEVICGNSSLAIGNKLISENQKTIPFFLIGDFSCYEEFSSLLGQQVYIEGTLEQSNDLFFFNLPQIHLDYVVDTKWKEEALETLSYEPVEISLKGKLYQTIYSGDTEYANIENDDIPETNLVLALERPIHIKASEKNSEFYETEKYVLELVVIPPNDNTDFSSMLNKNVQIRGTLFHSSIGHHHRRILCDAMSIDEIIE